MTSLNSIHLISIFGMPIFEIGLFEHRVKTNGMGNIENRLRDFDTILNKKIDNKINYNPNKCKKTKKSADVVSVEKSPLQIGATNDSGSTQNIPPN